jgi:hypothetical protein
VTPVDIPGFKVTPGMMTDSELVRETLSVATMLAELESGSDARADVSAYLDTLKTQMRERRELRSRMRGYDPTTPRANSTGKLTG